MQSWSKFVGAIALSVVTGASFAAPRQLVTHNLTGDESNAFVAGYIASQYPTKPNSDGHVWWALVKMACFGHTIDGKCTALIKMKTNTEAPVEIGTFTLNLDNGDITPKRLVSNGYVIEVNGPGETTIRTE